MNKIDQALMLCVSTDELKEWMKKPFYIDDKVISTDAYLMLIAKKSDNKEQYLICEHSNPNMVLNVIPKELMVIDFIK